MQEIKYQCVSSNDEKAASLFNEVLKKLPNYGGLARVSIEGFCDTAYYNQTTNTFEKITNLGGYHRDSFATSQTLTTEEEDQLYADVKRGGVCIMIRYAERHKNAGLKDFRILNISLTTKPFIIRAS